MNHKVIALIIVTLLLVPNIASDSNNKIISFFYGDYDESLFQNYIDIPVVAAVDEKTGIAGQVRIGVLKTKNNMIVFDSRTDIDDSTLESIIDAVKYAKVKTGRNADFFISYDLMSSSVSGKTTGSSVALGMLALLSNRSYNNNYIISGSVDSSGNLLKTGGLLTKIVATSKRAEKVISKKH